MRSSSRRGRLGVLVTLAVAVALGVSACGSDDDDASGDSGGSGDLTEIEVLIPFPGSTSFFSPYIAEELGYFEEEGLDVSVTAADGSSAVVQQVAAGNADYGLPGVGASIAAIAQGEDLVALYPYATRSPYQFVVLEDSEVETVQDLAGRNVGISSATGGEAPIIRAYLASEGVEANITEAGEGEAGGVALEQGRVDAYISSFPDIIAIEQQDIALRDLGLGQFEEFPDATLFVRRETLESEEDVIAGFGRAMSKATVYATANPEAALRILEDLFPEQITDFDESLVLLEGTLEFRQPTPAMNGQWGFNPPEVYAAYVDFLLEQGEIENEVDASTIYSNEFVETYNDFDAAAIEQEAQDAE